MVVTLMLNTPNVVDIWEAAVTIVSLVVLLIVAYAADRGYFDRAGDQQSTYKRVTAWSESTDLTSEKLISLEFIGLKNQKMQQREFYKKWREIAHEYDRETTMSKQSMEDVKVIEQIFRVRYGQQPLSRAQRRIQTGRQGTKKAHQHQHTETSGTGAVQFETKNGQKKNIVLENCGTTPVGIRFSPSEKDAVVYYRTMDGSAVSNKTTAAEGKNCHFKPMQWKQEGNSGKWAVHDDAASKYPEAKEVTTEMHAACGHWVWAGAKSGSDFVYCEGRIKVTPTVETTQYIYIDIVDDIDSEEEEEFYIELLDEQFNQIDVFTITVIDDDEPGFLQFRHDSVKVSENQEFVTLEIERVDGVSAKVAVKCKVRSNDKNIKVQDDPRKEGDDEDGGDDNDGNPNDFHVYFFDQKITFGPDEDSKEITIQINTANAMDLKGSFVIAELYDPEGGVSFPLQKGSKGEAPSGPQCQIKFPGKGKGLRDASLKKIFEADTWGGQFSNLIEPPCENKTDLFFWIVQWPFTFFFAFVPPPSLCGGYPCFVLALAFIAVLTMFIGDVATFTGCVLRIPAEVTAVTFVALGTSLPDTFASMKAAEDDENADASLGNITGSNSVNVFLGLGLPWLIGSIYWSTVTLETTVGFEDVYTEWLYLYKTVIPEPTDYSAAFMVPAGSLGISVVVFCICALTCFATLAFRRGFVGGELGAVGKSDLFHKATAVFVASLWFLYLAVAIQQTTPWGAGRLLARTQ